MKHSPDRFSCVKSARNIDVGSVVGAIVPDMLVEGISKEVTDGGKSCRVPDNGLHPALPPPTVNLLFLLSVLSALSLLSLPSLLTALTAHCPHCWLLLSHY